MTNCLWTKQIFRSIRVRILIHLLGSDPLLESRSPRSFPEWLKKILCTRFLADAANADIESEKTKVWSESEFKVELITPSYPFNFGPQHCKFIVQSFNFKLFVESFFSLNSSLFPSWPRDERIAVRNSPGGHRPRSVLSRNQRTEKLVRIFSFVFTNFI